MIETYTVNTADFYSLNIILFTFKENLCIFKSLMLRKKM